MCTCRMETIQRVIEFEVPSYYQSPPPLVFADGVALQIEGQTHRADLNGKFVVSVGRDGMRTLVMTAQGDTLSVTDSQLVPAELVVGARVTLVNLQGEETRSMNGSIGTIASITEETVSVTLTSGEVSVPAGNLVISPEGTDEVAFPLLQTVGKRRRLIASLTENAAAAAAAGGLSGAPALLSGAPVSGAASRLMAIDAAVAMSSAQPILKRCGTLRKLVHGFPGFAQLVISVVAKLHADPSHPARVMNPNDAAEAVRIASLLAGGPDLKALVDAETVQLETLLRIADRYCGANHLVFAIDSNFAGVRDSITEMVQRITTQGVSVAADLLDVLADTPIIPFNNALASRYAKREDNTSMEE